MKFYLHQTDESSIILLFVNIYYSIVCYFQVMFSITIILGHQKQRRNRHVLMKSNGCFWPTPSSGWTQHSVPGAQHIGMQENILWNFPDIIQIWSTSGTKMTKKMIGIYGLELFETLGSYLGHGHNWPYRYLTPEWWSTYYLNYPDLGWL